MQIISRTEAKAKGLRFYFTGEPCKHGHVAERWVSCWVCVDCDRKWRLENPEKKSAKNKKYWLENREELAEKGRK